MAVSVSPPDLRKLERAAKVELELVHEYGFGAVRAPGHRGANLRGLRRQGELSERQRRTRGAGFR
jgi:hypothetical protein